MRKARSSLAARLYGRLLLLTILISVAMALTVLHVARRQIKHEADVDLITAADTLYALMAEELDDVRAEGRTISLAEDVLSDEDLDAFERSADWRMFMISRDGRKLVGSDSAPPIHLLPTKAGLKTVRIGGVAWRIYSLAVPRDHLLIQVGEQRAIRNALIWNVARDLVWPVLLLVGGSAILLWLALQGGLFQLRRLGSSLGERQPGDTHRFDLAEWPRDLVPLVVTLNDLFGRIEAVLARERQFTDDAAHQLRTPLSALKLQLQALVRIEDAGQRAELTVDVIAAIDRAAALVSQMLLLARLDAARLTVQPVDVVAVVGEVMADQALVAARRSIQLDLDAEGETTLEGDALLLRLALANLLENAIKYGPEGAIVTVRLTDTADALRIAVIDRGAGIPPGERDAVRARFHRGSAAGSDGAGLGLAIVGSAIAVIGGTLEFADPIDEDGFAAILIFPRHG
ncbi:ATP-binding protein [Sphingomonas naphthae]|uniref:histidine kinase n=1 Tax=Sphingomonas naphthae TaxID=1813468 RepID=A0ABY7TIQ1_9SPHN|nr:ATP-binding protein [Sphingomonas naphthae]WCT72825.1 ATP-binding protein [Sphingomonas naphthae]